MSEFQTIRYEVIDPGDQGIAHVTMDRSASRNAQNKRMTYEVNAAFDDATRRTELKVILFDAEALLLY
jgi:enoyl-CoA hydratase